MKFQNTLSIGLLASSLPVALGWGTLGHYTVAYVAQNFVNSVTKAKFQAIIGDTSANYLASVATYADSYRYTTAGTFSAPFHYIDAMDNPPDSCGVDFERDCPEEGCIVSAINNYTARIQSASLSDADVLFAAKMIIHFVGDIHQPLHDENLDVGGNTISVTFDGVATNLHAVWDTSIPQKFAGTATLAHALTFATNLTTQINTGIYKSEAASWLKGIVLSDPVSTSMVWAIDTNAYVCTAVIPNGPDETESVDLGGAYYTANLPVVEKQLAKAGYRLAKWLDLIAAAI